MANYHFNLPIKSVETVAANRANEITKDYYNHLVGEINRGTVQRAVCRIEYPRVNHTTYHLISI